MTREEFIKLCGGIFTSEQSYKSYTLSEKYRYFWSFYNGKKFIENKEITDEEIVTIYAGVEIDNVKQRKKFSIEHIVPMSFINKYLRRQAKAVKKGACCNPFNFAASHREINSQRSSWPFDFDGDEIVRRGKLHIRHVYTDYGLDHENEWVVPSKSRGDVARAILYMSLIYNIREFYGRDIVELVKWAKIDPPGFWEIKYNQWVYQHRKIQNPFIQNLKGDISPLQLLTDTELLSSLDKKHTKRRKQKYGKGNKKRNR